MINNAECPVCKRPCQLNELRTFSVTQKSAPITKSTSSRSRGRVANTRHYNTRSNVRNLFHEQLNLNASMSNQFVASPNRSSRNFNPNAAMSPAGNNSNDIHAKSNSIDYSEINRLIEANLSRLLQNLNLTQLPQQNLNYNLQQPTNIVNNADMGNHVQHLQQNTFSNNLPQNNLLNNSINHVSSDKATSIIQSWNLKFDGSASGLNVDEFL